jgi:hypothetical protein
LEPLSRNFDSNNGCGLFKLPFKAPEKGMNDTWDNADAAFTKVLDTETYQKLCFFNDLSFYSSNVITLTVIL